MGHLLHWVLAIVIGGWFLITLLGLMIAEHERHEEHKYGKEVTKSAVTWREVKALQFYRADGTNMAKGRPTLAEAQSAKSENVDGLERWKDLLDDSGLHDSDGGFDGNFTGWN